MRVSIVIPELSKYVMGDSVSVGSTCVSVSESAVSTELYAEESAEFWLRLHPTAETEIRSNDKRLNKRLCNMDFLLPVRDASYDFYSFMIRNPVYDVNGIQRVEKDLRCIYDLRS